MKTVLDCKIGIVGGGPGGLTLARLLQMHGANVTVFERDTHRGARVQGGALDLHSDSGLAALEAADLTAAFRSRYRPNLDRLLIVNDQAEVLFVHMRGTASGLERPEIDRGPLRDLLLESLAPDTVQWNKKLDGAVARDDGFELRFSEGETVFLDLVIGADGASSRLRPLVTPIRPVYSGVTIVEGNVADPQQAPAVAALLNGKALCAVGGEKSLAMGTKGDGSITFYAGLKVPESWAKTHSVEGFNATERSTWFADNFSGWSPVWGPLFEHASALVVRPQYVYPFDQHWEAHSNITLIGDAAHVMPPYAGEGVNMAMLDALTLARDLLSGSDLKSAIAAYESEMFARTAAVAQDTMANTAIFHAPDADTQLVGMFQHFSAKLQEGSS